MKKQYKITSENLSIYGDLVTGRLVMVLSEEENRDFQLMSEKERLSYLNLEGIFEITRFRVKENEAPEWIEVEEIEVPVKGEETVTITVEEYENLLAARKLKDRYKIKLSKVEAERYKYYLIIDELSDVYGQDFFK